MSPQRFMPTTALILFIVLFDAHAAAAQGTRQLENQFVELRGLVGVCAQKDLGSRIACASYLRGFVAGSQSAGATFATVAVPGDVASGKVAPSDPAALIRGNRSNDRSSPFCIGSAWTALQVENIVREYAREHPEALREPPAGHILKALSAAFPCGKRTP